MSSNKNSTRNAILNFSKNQIEKPEHKTLKKNKKPEEETVKECMKWMKTHGFFVHLAESKSVYSPAAKTYVQSKTVTGHSDSVGSTPEGFASFVEFKAKGKKASFSFKQYQFLKRAIHLGCFACVTDSVDDLKFKYESWLDGADMMQFLPKKKKWFDEDPLFEE